MTETIQPLLSADPAWNSAAQETAIRMQVAESWPCSENEAPAVKAVSDEQMLYCPAGFMFDVADLATTRIQGYSDGWSYTAEVTTTFIPTDESAGRLKMTVIIDSLAWSGPLSVAHPMRGVFHLVYSQDVVLRCLPRAA